MMRKATETHRFYVPSDHVALDSIVFPTDEARHATKVLRLNAGDSVVVIDGRGRTYFCTLETITQKSAIATIDSREDEVAEPSIYIHMGVGLLKQSARWETFLEKAVELGVGRVTPLVSTRIQKHSFNRRRAEAIMVAALKQSGRSRLPQLDEPMDVQKVMESVDADCKMICHEQTPTAYRMKDLVAHGPNRIGVLIGPEGGFSSHEVEKAESLNWKRVWLGERRLRTETAAITTLAVLGQLLDE